MFPSIIQVISTNPVLRNQLFYGLFCALVAVILLYFWYVAQRSVGRRRAKGGAIVFLALAYLLYFVLALAIIHSQLSVAESPDAETAIPVTTTMLIISTLVNMCLLSALPFFADQEHWLDEIIEHLNWRNGVYLLTGLMVILISWSEGAKWCLVLDLVVSILALGLLAFFLGRYFWEHGLGFLMLLSSFFFLSAIGLLINPGELLPGGKFNHPNMSIFGPALALSTILLSYTFNWISDLQFQKVSGIWLQPAVRTPEGKAEPAQAGKSKKPWEARLAEDQIEELIEELILQKRSRNENLEMVISIAARNTRNNNQRIKELVSKEEYQVERNKVAQALLHLLQSGE